MHSIFYIDWLLTNYFVGGSSACTTYHDHLQNTCDQYNSITPESSLSASVGPGFQGLF
jgi:hypothetical protein